MRLSPSNQSFSSNVPWIYCQVIDIYIFIFFLPFVQLSNATSLLDEAQQPYSYLIESIRTRDTQIHAMREQVSLMEDDIRFVRKRL